MSEESLGLLCHQDLFAVRRHFTFKRLMAADFPRRCARASEFFANAGRAAKKLSEMAEETR